MAIKYTEEFELYSYGESLASQTARVGLAEKAIDYKQHRVGLNLPVSTCKRPTRQLIPGHWFRL